MYSQRVSIYQRCAELSQLLTCNSGVKDAHSLFLQILSEVFGYSAGGVSLGWNLIALSRKNSSHRDFQAIQSFLSSTGPFIQLIYKLMSDPHSRFEFPISLINSLLGGTGRELQDPFLISRLQTISNNEHSLSLNAFEFYFFHFAYILVKPQNSWQTVSWTPGEALYPILLEDYMSFFLPCDGSEVSPPVYPFSIQTPMRIPPPSKTMVQSPKVSLLRKPATNIQQFPHQMTAEAIHSTAVTSSSSGSNTLFTEKIWRSEVLINILSLFWLNVVETPSIPSRSSSHVDGSFGTTLEINKVVSSTVVVPTVEHILAVRMIVKHLHFFVNSGGPTNTTIMDMFKAEIWPLLRRKMYLFLCSSLNNWPLDASFRLVLETWLSYIQPWRYTNDSGEGVAKDLSRWHQFIIENDKFYSTIFKAIIRRFFRLDLGCNKNAFMLFRMCKVFDQSDLADILKGIEAAFKGTDEVKPLNMSHRDMTVLIGHTHLNPLEIYGTDQLFDSMFNTEFIHNVERLITDSVLPVYSDLKKLQLTLHEQSRNKSFSLLKSLFGGNSSRDNSLEEIDPDEISKTIGYLEVIVDQLTSIFDLPSMYKEHLISIVNSVKSIHISNLQRDANGSFEVDSGSGLPKPVSPQDRWKIINGTLKPNIRYTGNPDLILIRTDEVKFLVRFLYKISSKINAKFSHEFENLYGRKDIIGTLFREILEEPCYYYTTEKQVSGASKEKHYLTPRIVLRPLASHRTIFVLFVFYVVFGLFFGRSLFSTTVSLALYALFFIVCKAMYHHTHEILEKFYK